jgi:hypothetical protein
VPANSESPVSVVSQTALGKWCAEVRGKSEIVMVGSGDRYVVGPALLWLAREISTVWALRCCLLVSIMHGLSLGHGA